VLPVNDTSVYRMWWDSYPYSTLSVFALHPLYLRLQGLRLELPADILSDIAQLRERLDGPQVRAAISRAQAG
jgi:4-alpha-glucanotransferase